MPNWAASAPEPTRGALGLDAGGAAALDPNPAPTVDEVRTSSAASVGTALCAVETGAGGAVIGPRTDDGPGFMCD